MKTTTIVLSVLFALLPFSNAFSQSTFVYFKASQAYISAGNGKLTGPMSSSDIVTINTQQGEITFLSGSARVYKIIKGEYKKADNNNPTTEYTAQDREGNQILLSVIKMTDSKEHDTRIAFMNVNGTGLTVLEGNVQQVF